MVDEKEVVLPLSGFLFPRIFQAFRMSIQPTKLVLVFLALAAICLTGHLMDTVTKSVVVAPNGTTELDEYIANEAPVTEHIRLFHQQGRRSGVFTTLWNFGARRFHAALLDLSKFDVLGDQASPGVLGNIVMCFAALVWAFKYHPVYSVFFFAWILAMISLAGGAVSRIAALQFAQGERLGLTDALRFSTRKFYSFFTAPITPIAIIVVVGLSIVLLGLVGNIPVVGELSVGLFLPLALAAGALIAIIAIGALAGLNLMFPAIAFEDSDCFDAISRSFSYVYAKPWRMGFYTVIATLYGAICYGFVRFFFFLLLLITYLFLQFGFLHENEKLAIIWPGVNFTNFLGPPAVAPELWSNWIAYYLIRIWVLGVVGLMVSFVISFYFSANTIIYALMRKGVDRIALDEVLHSPEEETSEPTGSAKESSSNQNTSPCDDTDENIQTSG